MSNIITTTDCKLGDCHLPHFGDLLWLPEVSCRDAVGVMRSRVRQAVCEWFIVIAVSVSEWFLMCSFGAKL